MPISASQSSLGSVLKKTKLHKINLQNTKPKWSKLTPEHTKIKRKSTQKRTNCHRQELNCKSDKNISAMVQNRYCYYRPPNTT